MDSYQRGNQPRDRSTAPLSSEKQGRIWDHYQVCDTEKFTAGEARLRCLARRIPPGSRVLNVGVGAGLFEKHALARGIDVYALDPSEQAIASIRETCGLDEKARVGYGQQMPFDNDFFDFVVISEVLEHLTGEVLEETLREIRRVLKDGGRILGTVPAREDLQSQIALCPHCGKTFHRWGHERAFTVASTKTLLSQWFTVETVTERQFVHWRQLNWRGKLIAAFRLLLSPLTSSGKNIVFQARKDRVNG